mgnify:FL=1
MKIMSGGKNQRERILTLLNILMRKTEFNTADYSAKVFNMSDGTEKEI